MTDYTPTTEDIQDGYRWLRWDEEFLPFEVSNEQFQRWLRKVKAEAWSECYDLWALGPAGDFPDREENPYL